MPPAPRVGVPMAGVREYAESYPVHLRVEEPSDGNQLARRRVVIDAVNEAGHNGVAIDLFELLAWLRAHVPEVLDASAQTAGDLADLETRLAARLDSHGH